MTSARSTAVFEPWFAILIYMAGLILVSCGGGGGSGLDRNVYSGIVGARGLAIGDVNGDGLNDLVLSQRPDLYEDLDNLLVYHQSSHGRLSPPVQYYVGAARSLAIGDLDNDGLNDIAIGTREDFSALYQNEIGSLDPPVGYGSGSSDYSYFTNRVRIGDVNGDGLNDVVLSHFSVNTMGDIDIYYQSIAGISGSPETHTLPFQDIMEIKIADMNNDALLDIVIFGKYYGPDYDLVIMYQQENGTMGQPEYLDSSLAGTPYCFDVGDINRDGVKDIAIGYDWSGGDLPREGLMILARTPTGSYSLANVIHSSSDPSPDHPKLIDIDDAGMGKAARIFAVYREYELLVLNMEPESFHLSNVQNRQIAPESRAAGSNALAVGDINDNGDADAAVSNDYWDLQGFITYLN